MKILVADDLLDNRYLLESALKSSGYDVVTASDGREALDILHIAPVDMIISDILMPNMDGFQFCREVKKDRKLRKIPFIFYTASYTSPEDKRFGLGIGADSYIVKPVQPGDFLEIVEGLLKGKDRIMPCEAVLKEIPTEEYLRDYCSRVFNQLERKISELEEKNQALLRSESALKNSERKFYELFNNISEAVFMQKVGFRGERSSFIEVNDTACRRLGYSRDELLGMNTSDINRDYLKKDSEKISELKENGRINFEALHLRKDGSAFPVDVTARLFKMGDDEYIVSLARDLTKEKESRVRESEALERIEDNLIQLSILNDEIRNPLAVITGIACIEESEGSKEILNQVDKINNIIRRLDKGWLESAKIRNYLMKYHGFSDDGEEI